MTTNEMNNEYCLCESPRSVLHTHLSENPPGRNRKLVAFLKESRDSLLIDEQLRVILAFCEDHLTEIVAQIIDDGPESLPVQEIIEALRSADGIIVSDLNRLVEHIEQGNYLGPVLHEFFCGRSPKRLVSVCEGLDTKSIAGQFSAIELLQRPDADIEEPDITDFSQSA